MKSASHRRRSGSGTYLAFVLPASALYTLFLIVPIGIGIYYSLTNWNGVSRTHEFIGLDNYIKMFQDSRMLNSLGFTFRYTAMLVVGVLVLALACALCLNMRIKGQTFFRAVFFFPAVLSMVVIGLMWNEILYRIGPMIGQALNIEILKKSILSDPATAQYGILLVNLWQGVATPTVLLLAGLQVIPQELYEAATIDGANAWHRFRSITLPYLMPVLNVVLVLTLKAGLTLFDLLRGMTDGGPGRATESIGLLIYRNAFAENRFSFGVAQSVVLFLIIALVSVVQFWLTREKEGI
ncbi:MAG: sugar ABC transporter permease [Eubacteriales bacterium]|nr:sugar ABC transporter permease [Eubacteriales bacterium]